MANAPLSIPEKAALQAILLLGGTVSNIELNEELQFTIDRPVRESLIDRRYITAYKSKELRGAFVHELTEEGWKRCREHFADDVPTGSHKGYRLMYRTLQWFHAYMDRSHVELADVGEPVDAGVDGNPSGVDGADDGPPTVEDEILSAYQNLASEPGAWIGLAELREALPGLPRAEVDQALRRIAELPQVYFTPEVNQKTLTEADREAAVHLGGEDKHLLSVGSA
ncbi:hypothetical protein [Saccharothrix obliqua]|uniref:hypothetical protein n=1 Tax=Saccharothrix obliqua TaxID=2861747 RepID=UPI001C604702|nr:hypothetical protein [Saccharothrix obliqua]MBW4720346.1 hypothetical protein [Saccharothrix obliqua]